MISLQELVGPMWHKEIKSDVDALVKSLSHIHLDELITKYGEIGAFQYFVFIMEVHMLKYFNFNRNGYCLYTQYFNKHLKELRPIMLEALRGY